MDKDVLVTQENVLESASEIENEWETIKSSVIRYSEWVFLNQF